MSLFSLLQLRHKFSSFQTKGTFVYFPSYGRRSIETTDEVKPEGRTTTNTFKPSTDNWRTLFDELFSKDSEEKRNKNSSEEISEAYSYCIGTIAENYISFLIKIFDVRSIMQKIKKNVYGQYIHFANLLSNITSQYINLSGRVTNVIIQYIIL